jgi:2-oxoglutarate ferredoxin oxidoreductase subunit alpha
LIDTYYDLPDLDLDGFDIRPEVVRTGSDYLRYRFTDDGISPRGVPGYGEGLVCVDSDEHDEAGRITEDMTVRKKMVDKRLRKARGILEAAGKPRLEGNPEYRYLVICWGSTYQAVREAMSLVGRDDLAMLHFDQVHPIHPGAVDYLQRAEHRVCLEQNATGQFERLLRNATGYEMDRSILKYDGLPFTVEDIAGHLESL